MKKAQGLPITTIIIVILAVIVLVVVIAMLAAKTQTAGKQLKEIEEQTCKSDPSHRVLPIDLDCDAMFGDCQVIYGYFKDVGPNQACYKIKRLEQKNAKKS